MPTKLNLLYNRWDKKKEPKEGFFRSLYNSITEEIQRRKSPIIERVPSSDLEETVIEGSQPKDVEPQKILEERVPWYAQLGRRIAEEFRYYLSNGETKITPIQNSPVLVEETTRQNGGKRGFWYFLKAMGARIKEELEYYSSQSKEK